MATPFGMPLGTNEFQCPVGGTWYENAPWNSPVFCVLGGTTAPVVAAVVAAGAVVGATGAVVGADGAVVAAVVGADGAVVGAAGAAQAPRTASASSASRNLKLFNFIKLLL